MKKAEGVITWKNEILRYKTAFGTYFKIDGDLTRVLEVRSDNLDYVLHWVREKLRKLENGQIKVVKGSLEGSRDWEQEEKIKRQLWEDINVNSFPKGIDFEDMFLYNCQDSEIKMQTDCSGFWPRQERSPSPPCKIS